MDGVDDQIQRAVFKLMTAAEADVFRRRTGVDGGDEARRWRTAAHAGHVRSAQSACQARGGKQGEKAEAADEPTNARRHAEAARGEFRRRRSPGRRYSPIAVGNQLKRRASLQNLAPTKLRWCNPKLTHLSTFGLHAPRGFPARPLAPQ